MNHAVIDLVAPSPPSCPCRGVIPVFAAILSAGLVLAPPALDACACAPPVLDDAIERADSVLSGRVVTIEPSSTQLRARVAVDSVWKGPIVSTLDVYTASDSAVCGFPFEVGARYLIYATSLAGDAPQCELPWYAVETHLCSGTGTWNDAEAAALDAALGGRRWTAPPRAFRRGDLDGDGSLGLSDAVRLLDHLFRAGAAPECADIADLNDDGRVDLSDPVYGLNWLFLGGPPLAAPGPERLGFDATTGDPFRCGDAAALGCEQRASSSLPGVTIEIVDAPCELTLAEAAAGVTFTYRVLVESPLTDVTTRPSGTCQQQGPAGLFLLPRISGGEQSYCLCDLGKCVFDEHVVDLAEGSDAAAFVWCGRNWFGPSDFNNPIGEPFPPGRYRFEVRGGGVWARGKGPELPFELVAESEFDLVP